VSCIELGLSSFSVVDNHLPSNSPKNGEERGIFAAEIKDKGQQN